LAFESSGTEQYRLSSTGLGCPRFLYARVFTGSVDLVAEDEDRAVGQLLVRQQRVQLRLRLDEPGTKVKIVVNFLKFLKSISFFVNI
jgi:hypothetical protein